MPPHVPGWLVAWGGLCVCERERERGGGGGGGWNLGAVPNIGEDNEVFNRIKILIVSSKLKGFPWILVTPCY